MELQNSIDYSQYQSIKKIGKGNFAIVYEVKDIKTGKSYAAKISKILFDDKIDEKQVLNIIREVNIMFKVKHPAIIKYIGFSPYDFEGNLSPTLITELITKGSLKNIIDSEKAGIADPRWDFTQKLITLYGISSAMSFLHAHNIIHRDLKPDNIMMDDELCPKVADFGLSKILHFNDESMTMQSTTKFKGTMIYSPPEALKDSEITQKGDVYAFSMIAYEIMTLEMPYSDCTNYPKFIQKIMNSIRPEFDSTVPECYQSLIKRCWAEKPTDRPSFDEIIDILKNDQEFITDMIDEEKYLNYIDFVDESIVSFNKGESILSFDQFIKMKKSKELEIDSLYKKFSSMKESSPNDLKSAAHWCKLAADKGHIEAMYQYGCLLNNGFGVDINKGEAALYYKKAADKGHVEAMYEYALMMKNGDGIEVNVKESVNYFKNAADKGHLEAMFNYAILILNEKKIESYQCFIKAADKGHVESMYQAAMILFESHNSLDKKNSIRYFLMAANNGHVESMYQAAMILFKSGDPLNIRKAIQFFKTAADKGHVESMAMYGDCLHRGLGIEIDEVESAKYFKKAADNGNIPSIYNYALCLYHGWGTDINYIEAAKLFKKALDGGQYEAANNIAAMFINGQGVPENKKEALKYYKIGADNGIADSMFSYAYMMNNGIGVTANLDESIKYYKKAADLGQFDAMRNYAILILNGKGDTSDPNEAVKYLKLAADGGHLESMITYASLLQNGDGIPADKPKAAMYYKKAADKGFVNGMIIYLSMLINGDGIKKDYKEAAKY